MPVLQTTAFVNVETVTTLIRALANDQIYSSAGEILTDTNNSLFPLMNDSLEWFQNEVNNHGIDTFTKETILTPVTAATFNDPGQQVNISDTGYFDGTTNHSLPQVPTDLLVPHVLWERQTGSTQEWLLMRECRDGLPSIPQSSRLGIWEWRQDGIYMVGATQSNDLRLRYEGTHATFATVNDQLLFRGATGSIAYKTVSSWLASKNPEAAQIADGEANRRVSQLATRNARMKQRILTTRRSYGNRLGGNWFFPPRNN